MKRPRSWLLLSLVLVGAAARLIPHPPNFTPVGALALFSGAAFVDWRMAFAVPLVAMFGSDVALGAIAGDWTITFHTNMPAVYLAFIINVVLGMWLLRRRSLLRVAGVSLLGALQFFVITNFSVWALGDWYPKTPLGLLECYIAALPFFQNQVLGDLAFAGILFGSLALAEFYVPAFRNPVAEVGTNP
jgi:hypothetical protein